MLLLWREWEACAQRVVLLRSARRLGEGVIEALGNPWVLVHDLLLDHDRVDRLRPANPLERRERCGLPVRIQPSNLVARCQLLKAEGRTIRRNPGGAPAPGAAKVARHRIELA